MEKNKIISLSTTLLYSFVLVISFLCFYHSIVESSWLLEIIVSLFVLIGVNLLSYKTKTKEIIFPIVMTFIIGIIYSFQSFYYGFWGIINYCIQWYNVQFDDARNLMMTKAITTSHIQAFSNEEIKEMILSMCKDRILKIVEKHEDADFVYVNDLGRHRVNIYFQQGYMTAAIRIINEQIKTLEELNLPDVLHKLALLPRGLVLVTGPTGSGKSTILAAMIDFISSMRNCHILTIEDPIEYVYQQKQALIHQREVYEDVDSFDTALKSAMREDPDVILVGEMRDYETIQAVITLAETGHLVFSTLHTIGAPKTIDRIIDVFPPHKQAQIRAQLASVLQAVVTQQLLPLASGKGRAAALEIMIANDAIKNLIRENKGHQIDTMIQTGRNEGMTTLNASLATLVNTGKVNRMVAERYSLDVGELRQLIR